MASVSHEAATTTPIPLPLAGLVSIPPGLSPEGLANLELAEAAFIHSLPTLLAESPGQWVAYLGSKCLGYATSKAVLYRECRASGLADDDILFCCIEPQNEEMLLGPGTFTDAKQ